MSSAAMVTELSPAAFNTRAIRTGLTPFISFTYFNEVLSSHDLPETNILLAPNCLAIVSTIRV